MEQNCLPADENGQPNRRRWGFDVAERRANNDPVNAAPRGPFSVEDLEHITRRLEAIKVAEAVKVADGYGSETDSNDSTSDDASLMGNETLRIGSEITWEAHTTAQILSGADTAGKHLEEVRDTYWNNVGKMQERFWDVHGDPRELIAFKTSELDHLQEYRRQLLHLIRVVRRQLGRKESVVAFGIQRSQQYQDRLASNTEYLPRLEDQHYRIKRLTDIKQDELKKLEEAEDVARATHPRHAELAWIFCYTHTCAAHRLSKERFGYWPMKKKAIYWDHESRTGSIEITHERKLRFDTGKSKLRNDGLSDPTKQSVVTVGLKTSFSLHSTVQYSTLLYKFLFILFYQCAADVLYCKFQQVVVL
jgi:hypothetical protein